MATRINPKGTPEASQNSYEEEPLPGCVAAFYAFFNFFYNPTETQSPAQIPTTTDLTTRELGVVFSLQPGTAFDHNQPLCYGRINGLSISNTICLPIDLIPSEHSPLTFGKARLFLEVVVDKALEYHLSRAGEITFYYTQKRELAFMIPGCTQTITYAGPSWDNKAVATFRGATSQKNIQTILSLLENIVNLS